jgi:hypothetical protein
VLVSAWVGRSEPFLRQNFSDLIAFFQEPFGVALSFQDRQCDDAISSL